MRKCNLRGIMGAAWRRYRTGTVSFSLTLNFGVVKRKNPPRRHGGLRNRRGNPHIGRVEAAGL